MRLWKVTMRCWPYEGGSDGVGHASVLVMADDTVNAKRLAYDHAMGTVYFGKKPEAVEVASVAPANLPYLL